MGRVVIPGFRKIETSGGGEGGTTNYNDLTNKPSINNVPLVGNLKTVDLKLTDATLTEEGVPAEAKTVGQKLEEQSTSLTALSGQLGNHTVKSDVPENAVFTDTVYDDTEVKESIDELNSNLSDSAYGDNGGYNIFKDTTWFVGRHMTENGINDYPETGSAYSDYISIVEPNTYYISSFTHPKSTVFEYDANKSFIKYNGWKKDNNTPCVLSGNCAYIRISFNGASSNIQPSNVMLAKTPATPYEPYIPSVKMLAEEVSAQKNDLSKQCKKDDITTNETLIGTFNGKNYYRKLFTGISGSGGSVTVNVGGKIEIYNYYGRAYMYGQSGASDVKYPIPNKNYYIESQSISETSFQLTIPTSSDTRKVDLVIEYTKVDE